MSRSYDVTIFGATGLTGRHIVEQVFDFGTIHPSLLPDRFQWAVAGRNQEALEVLVDRYIEKYPRSKVPRPAILIANVVKRDTLDAMANQSKTIINAVGPFRFMGEYVVRSCVEQGCDYVDVTGEPEFVERMQRTYHDQAKRKNVTIVHCCGFDSVPADMGTLFVKRQFVARGWTPAHVEMFLRIHCGELGLRAGYATFESAVHGFGSAELLREIRRASKLPRLPQVGPKLKIHSRPGYDKALKMYRVPFQFADPSVVRLSQQLFLSGAGEPPEGASATPMPPTVQFAAYVLLPTFWIFVLYHVYGLMFMILSSTPWGRNMLLAHPERFTHGVFSKQEPTDEGLKQTSFDMILRAKGYSSAVIPADAEPNQSIQVIIRGPEMGYIATPRMVFQCALVLCENKNRIPRGVMTPSVAFWNTDLLDRLQRVGITFTEEEE
ncbi:saccharopine dehydrogenase [Dichotomocladium elegans]|nr:saccharopine dehydrogenase [Dichotomocladium elegans]